MAMHAVIKMEKKKFKKFAPNKTKAEFPIKKYPMI